MAQLANLHDDMVDPAPASFKLSSLHAGFFVAVVRMVCARACFAAHIHSLRHLVAVDNGAGVGAGLNFACLFLLAAAAAPAAVLPLTRR